MTKLIRAAILALPLVLFLSGTAAAQETYPPSVAPTASVAGVEGSASDGGGGTAFTGSGGLGAGAIAGSALLVVGLGSLYVGWRRAERVTVRR